MNAKPYDLAERTFLFAKEVREFAQTYPKNHLKLSDIQQLIRSSGSVGANYIEANESLGKKVQGNLRPSNRVISNDFQQ